MSGKAPRDAASIQLSMGDPPQLIWIKPIGIFKTSFRSFPKKYAVALKLLTDSGLASCQDAGLMVSCGKNCEDRGTVINRIFLLDDLRMASLDPIMGCPLKPFKGISIFDCPLQSQTSPMRTFFRTVS